MEAIATEPEGASIETPPASPLAAPPGLLTFLNPAAALNALSGPTLTSHRVGGDPDRLAHPPMLPARPPPV